ncbi:MAG: S-DNA-T family DNA segregation ATPase FtsK/SpoIIIE [Psychromonas sp.]
MSKNNFLNRLSGVQKLLEVGIIGCAFAAIFISISLLTFSPVDPSWSQQQWVSEIQNAGGMVGSWIADILFYGFGLLAYFIPVLIAVFAWFFLWKPKFSFDMDFLNLGLRIIGFISTVFSTTALASLNFDDYHYYPSGGLVGDIIAQSMSGFFSLLAINFILLTLLVSGITFLLGFSWLSLIDSTGAFVIISCTWLMALPERFSLWREKRIAEKNSAFNEKELDWDVTKNQRKTAVEQPASSDLEAKKMPAEKVYEGPDDTDFNYSDIDDLDIDEQYFDAPFDIDAVEDDQKIDLDAIDDDKKDLHSFSSAAPETENIPAFITEPAAQKAVKPQPAVAKNQSDEVKAQPAVAPKNNFDHLPEHAKPAVKRKKVENMAAFPSIDLLDRPDKKIHPISQEELDTAARLVEAKLLEFKIKAEVVNVLPGPVITRFELSLAPGMKVSTVSGLEKDLARALSAMSVRVVDQIPGKSVIALELPNKHREIVYSSEVLGSAKFMESKSPLSMVLGADISGQPVVVDLAKMPHLLVAGTTGSGKSVGVNCMLVSLLYKSTPEDVRLILIDPKMLELSVYEGIPHLLAEVVTDMKDAANALRWCVGEMERRYKLLSEIGVRTLASFNSKVKEAADEGTPLTDPLWKEGDSMDLTAPELTKLPSIVVVVDEFADMMMIVGKKCEELITRIAQKARAAGIHLILATQRPSVDVITGLIKANIPTRIAFQVSSKIDSRTILGMQGAETLLGHGDMLYMPPGVGVPTRVHGAFVDDHEVHRVVADWKKRGEPNYVQEIIDGDSGLDMLLPGEEAEGANEIDALFDEVVEFITETRKVSISSIQRKFRIGYNRSARLVDQLQAQGVISAPSGANSNRDVLAPPPVKD